MESTGETAGVQSSTGSSLLRPLDTTGQSLGTISAVAALPIAQTSEENSTEARWESSAGLPGRSPTPPSGASSQRPQQLGATSLKNGAPPPAYSASAHHRTGTKIVLAPTAPPLGFPGMGAASLRRPMSPGGSPQRPIGRSLSPSSSPPLNSLPGQVSSTSESTVPDAPEAPPIGDLEMSISGSSTPSSVSGPAASPKGRSKSDAIPFNAALLQSKKGSLKALSPSSSESGEASPEASAKKSGLNAIMGDLLSRVPSLSVVYESRESDAEFNDEEPGASSQPTVISTVRSPASSPKHRSASQALPFSAGSLKVSSLTNTPQLSSSANGQIEESLASSDKSVPSSQEPTVSSIIHSPAASPKSRSALQGGAFVPGSLKFQQSAPRFAFSLNKPQQIGGSSSLPPRSPPPSDTALSSGSEREKLVSPGQGPLVAPKLIQSPAASPVPSPASSPRSHRSASQGMAFFPESPKAPQVGMSSLRSATPPAPNSHPGAQISKGPPRPPATRNGRIAPSLAAISEDVRPTSPPPFFSALPPMSPPTGRPPRPAALSIGTSSSSALPSSGSPKNLTDDSPAKPPRRQTPEHNHLLKRSVSTDMTSSKPVDATIVLNTERTDWQDPTMKEQISHVASSAAAGLRRVTSVMKQRVEDLRQRGASVPVTETQAAQPYERVDVQFAGQALPPPRTKPLAKDEQKLVKPKEIDKAERAPWDDPRIDIQLFNSTGKRDIEGSQKELLEASSMQSFVTKLAAVQKTLRDGYQACTVAFAKYLDSDDINLPLFRIHAIDIYRDHLAKLAGLLNEFVKTHEENRELILEEFGKSVSHLQSERQVTRSGAGVYVDTDILAIRSAAPLLYPRQTLDSLD